MPLKAGEGARTLDIQLGRLTLYQLSYTRKELLIVDQGPYSTEKDLFCLACAPALSHFTRTPLPMIEKHGQRLPVA